MRLFVFLLRSTLALVAVNLGPDAVQWLNRPGSATIVLPFAAVAGVRLALLGVAAMLRLR